MPLLAAGVAAPMRKLWLEKLCGTPTPARISLIGAVRTARDRGRPSWKRKRGPPEFPLTAPAKVDKATFLKGVSLGGFNTLKQERLVSESTEMSQTLRWSAEEKLAN